MSNFEPIIVPPDVARISEGLRDTGYEFKTAIADIIDNSIAAGATLIDVRVDIDFIGKLAVSVGDNGCGMDRDGLINAMKYGSKQREDLASLGKFGLGLKTASTAFCRKLSLISRYAPDDTPIKSSWDLDFMEQSNSWALSFEKPDGADLQLLNEVAPEQSGTLVLWDKIDRLLSDYQDPTGKPIKSALSRMLKSLEEHISTVYQRYIDVNDDRVRDIKITLNSEVVTHWDPFFLIETNEPTLEKIIPVQLPSGQKTSFTIKAFILPKKEEITNDDNRKLAKISNERQGVYVYREGRLIHGPDWLGMYKQEPHLSLLRVDLSFGHELDEAFQVDIKKSRILLNDGLYEFVREKFLPPARREAENRYRKGTAASLTGKATLLHGRSGNAIKQKSSVMKTARITSVNKEDETVTINNNSGETVTPLRIITTEDPNELNVSTSSTLDNGVLWEAAIVNKDVGVILNTGHPFYPKSYLPHKGDSSIIQSLDFLLWSLAQAELNNVNDDNKEAFEEFRIEVSRNLKKLVSDLPDPIDSED